MRIIHKDLEEDKIKLQAENLNDLWHLQHLISPGDVVISSTWRRKKSKDDKIRPERQEKERVKVSLRIKKVEFQEFSNKLRLLGEIEKGPNSGNHHTINIEKNSKFTLIKKWESDHLKRLEEAKKASNRPKVILVALDDESATFGLVRQYGLKELGDVSSTASGKMYESDREASEEEYYQKVCSAIENYLKSRGASSVIIAGPGFAKKKVLSELEEDYPEIASKAHLGNTSHTGTSGLNEIIRRGIVRRVSEKDRTSLETRLVEEMMEEIAKDGKAVYEDEKVGEAADLGAVEKLLVSDQALRKRREEVEPVMREARNKGAEVYVISSDHEAGNQLARIGGIGALLRYKIS